jgi:hypothetical protein
MFFPCDKGLIHISDHILLWCLLTKWCLLKYVISYTLFLFCFFIDICEGMNLLPSPLVVMVVVMCLSVFTRLVCNTYALGILLVQPLGAGTISLHLTLTSVVYSLPPPFSKMIFILRL